jgi:hypothetical protein
MPVKVTSTKRDLHYIKMCVYGKAGVGKTVLCATAPNPVIISAEAGLLSLADKDIPAIDVFNLADLRDAFQLVKDSQYETVCLDSISDIAEQILDTKMTDLQKAADEVGGKMDPRQAYGRLAIEMAQLARAFRALEKHVIFTAKQDQTQDDMKMLYGPAIPGKQFTQSLPYLMDFVLCLQVSKDGTRFLKTQPDMQYQAKDRSGKLDNPERPDISYIIKKVIN